MTQQATQTDASVIDELRWRGLIHVTEQGHELYTPGLDDLLAHEKITAYIGFDPSADSLHIGNLLVIMLLVRMQRHGHTPIAIAGGGTGLIGDPAQDPKSANCSLGSRWPRTSRASARSSRASSISTHGTTPRTS